jgi:predicted acyl esterase
VLGRPDVLATGRTAWPQATTLAGPVRARLSIGAEGSEPALWAATLCVERPDGALHNLCEGVARTAADATHVDVELGDACIEIAPGEALVTLIAGSSFPRWPRPRAERTQHVLEGSLLEVTVADV